jgi:DNA processing protein
LTLRDLVAKRLTLVSDVEEKLSQSEPGYPERLRPVADAPAELYVRGVYGERELAVAIVGARAASGEGVEQARELAAELGQRGAQIVSGGALGIDAAAHRGALDAGAHTAAVLACGLDKPYPARNRHLFAEIRAAGGALLSPYARGRPPRGFHFVHRNRVMAGMVDAVIVVDCGTGSGAMHTAEAAWRYGRTVGARPGTPGCEALIAQGAAVVHGASDVLAAVAGEPRRPVVELPKPGSELAAVLAALAGDEPRDEGDVSDMTGFSMRSVTRALAELELAGLALLVPGRAYVRSQTAQNALASS